MLTPRPYQQEALDTLDKHLRSGKGTSPCIAIPTGGGKSLVIAMAIQRWRANHPGLRVCVLQHRKELVQQNSEEFQGIAPDCAVGIYAAALKRRDTEHNVIYASIDSIYNKSGELEPFDVIIVDEAHRIPIKGEGKYRKFIDGCKRWNPKMVVVGVTATPYRMDGPICHRDHVLQELIYNSNVSKLIDDGYLSKLRTRCSDNQPDLSKVRKASGDYVAKALSEQLDKEEVVSQAVKELVAIINAEKRKSVVIFAIDISHCKHISDELRKYGIKAPHVTAKTAAGERDRIVADFKKGHYRVLVNVNVYTEGFNAKQVDCVALLRPTLSKGLYVQMVGRGLRLHPGKTDCLVLDFSHCIEEHGPIDAPDDREVRIRKCDDCADSFSYLLGKCPNCGWEIPPGEARQVGEELERERRLHEVKATARDILSKPEWVDVSGVKCHLRKQPGKPDALRVQYRCGVRSVSEVIHLDDTDNAKRNTAKHWWNRLQLGPMPSVEHALQDMFLCDTIKARISKLLVALTGERLAIHDYEVNTDKSSFNSSHANCTSYGEVAITH